MGMESIRRYSSNRRPNFKLKGNLNFEATNYPSNLKDNVRETYNVTARNETEKQGIQTAFRRI